MSLFLKTERLTLRSFTMDDLDNLAAMNADARVMEYFPAPLSHDESAGFLQRIMAHEAAHGFSLLAVHKKEDGAFCGFTGLLTADFDAPFLPAVEIGWRLVHAAWGQGLGPEAARACLELGFGGLQLEEIISFTAVKNSRSIRVMEKIGMERDRTHDFDHPNVSPGHALRPHVLYRLRRDKWNAWQS